MTIAERINGIKSELPDRTRLVAVSKFHSVAAIKEAYDAGHRMFGENRLQEIVTKRALLPDDILWHFIGHLQTNKVKQLVPFVSMIESVDSDRLLQEINQQASSFGRIINVLLQIHIAAEETKFGFSYEECRQILLRQRLNAFENIRICGLMGMATFTNDERQIREELAGLAAFFREMKTEICRNNPNFNELSMGMSNDYRIAIAEGSTLVRIGSNIFGTR